MITNDRISANLLNKVIKRIAPVMILMYVFNQFHRANVGYASLSMNADLGMTAAQFGLATSLFYIGYILFEIPSNLIMHRVGARLWMARILLTWGIVSSLCGLVSSKEWLWTARFFLGVFEAGLFPGLVYYMTLWLPARDRLKLMSFFVMAIPITGTLGAPNSTLIMEHLSLFGLSGWRTMLLIEGFPAILLAFYVYFSLPDNPACANWLSEKEKDELKSALENEKKITSGDTHTTFDVIRNWKVWMLGAVYFSINAGIIGLLYFLPQVVKSMEANYSAKYSIIDIGLISAIPFGFSVLAVWLWARFASARILTSAYVSGPLVICAIALASALYMPSVYLSLAAFAVGTSACFCSMVTFWQLPSRFLSGRAAAAGIALITSIGVSAGVIMPYLIGELKDQTGGYATSFIVISLCMIIASLIITRLERSLNHSHVAEFI